MLFVGTFFCNFLHFTGMKKFNAMIINTLNKNPFPVILIPLCYFLCYTPVTTPVIS